MGMIVGFVRALFTRWDAPRLSRVLIALSLALLAAWLQAHLLLAALRDDGTTLHGAVEVLDSGDARAQVGAVTDWVLTQAGALTGGDAALKPVRDAVTAVLATGPLPAGAQDAIVGTLLDLRDDAVSQFTSVAPAQALAVPLAPLLGALGVEVPPDLPATLGVDASLTVPVMTAEGVDSWRGRYHLAVLLDTWGLLAAGVAEFVGVLLSPRPLRAFAVGLRVGGALALAAVPLFGLLQTWLLGGGAGPWGPLVTPVVTGAIAEISPWLVPGGIAAIVVGAGLLAWWIVRERRGGAGGASDGAANASDGAADAREHAVDERA